MLVTDLRLLTMLEVWKKELEPESGARFLWEMEARWKPPTVVKDLPGIQAIGIGQSGMTTLSKLDPIGSCSLVSIKMSLNLGIRAPIKLRSPSCGVATTYRNGRHLGWCTIRSKGLVYLFRIQEVSQVCSDS